MTKHNVCISLQEGTKNKLKAMGSKGDTYDDVIKGLIEISSIISKPEIAKSLARDSGMDEQFVKDLLKFHEGLRERGMRYRNHDYEAQKMLVRLDLLG